MSNDNEIQEVPEGMVVKATFLADIPAKGIDQKLRRVTAVISSDAVDRVGDVIRVEGWELENFRKNPVVMFGHDYERPPIGRAVELDVVDVADLKHLDLEDKRRPARPMKIPHEGNAEGFMPRSGKVLRAVTEFADTDLGSEVFDLYAGGFMRAFSVGFKAKAFKAIYAEDEHLLGFEFTRQELLEYSAVPIPANPEALVAAISAGRFNATRSAFEKFGSGFKSEEKPHQALDVGSLDAVERRLVKDGLVKSMEFLIAKLKRS